MTKEEIAKAATLAALAEGEELPGPVLLAYCKRAGAGFIASNVALSALLNENKVERCEAGFRLVSARPTGVPGALGLRSG